MKKTILAIATAGALAIATALPASAAPLADGADFPIVNGVTWGGFNESSFMIDDAETNSDIDAFDGFGQFEWYIEQGDQWSSDVQCFNADVTEDAGHPGDYVLTCDSDDDIFDVAGFNSKVSGRLYAEGDMMRLEYTLTNTSNSTQNVSWWSQTSYGDSSLADSAETDLARGFDIQNAGYGYDEGVAFGLPGAAQSPDDLGVINVTNDYIEVYGPEAFHALAPGKSITIVLFFFHAMAGTTAPLPSDSYDSLTGWATDWFSDWNERLSRGISDDVFVGNWMTTDPSASTDLAETGVDATAGLGFGVLALATGGALVVARRRRNA